DSAVIWARTDRETEMNVALDPAPEAGALLRAPVRASDDYTARLDVRGLRPSKAYRYSVWFGDDRDAAREGRFRTAPPAGEAAPVSIAWTGDFAGQNVCRDAREGFPIFDAIAAEWPDLFVGLGDMIYADNKCRPTGRYRNAQVPGDFAEATDLPGFWAHWRYARADAASQRLLARTSYVGIWDDHEVVNDFGPLHDTRETPPYTPGERLLPIGLKAFLDYTPLARDPRAPGRLYRRLRWGRHAELFVLDGRQYRDANLALDSAAQPKTMLGREQLAWLLAGLAESDATWKIVVSSVPISIPTGVPPELGRDGFADFAEEADAASGGAKLARTGFEAELTTILRKLQSLRARALFITTDVHFAEVFRYTPFADDPSFVVHEAVVGPGNAGVFPNRAFDRSFGPEVLFFHGPESADAITSWDEAKRWFNYGAIAIDAKGELTLRVKDTVGKTLYELALKP
ncbi:MAG TPA: alkaline phosphatase D family protein, partial [Myxococcota bacterium]|nr:alkaline phosphatase D family protein [Myxococcota bacterium]